MMSSLLSTTLAALALGAPPDRVAVDCSVSERAGQIDLVEGHATAVRCAGAPGFFLHRALYKELRSTEISAPYDQGEVRLLEEQVVELRLAATALTRSSSAADVVIARKGEIILLERERANLAEERAERSWYEHPGIWVLAGAGLTILTAWAYARVQESSQPILVVP